MPPHRFLARPSSHTLTHLWHNTKYLLLVATLALGGCASNAKNESANSTIRTERNTYLSQTKADPLGAYLTKYQYPSSSNPGISRALATTALNFIGIKYRMGGETPNTGFDCSGLVIYAAEKSLGLKLPRSAAEIAHEGESVRRNELKTGDLVFFNTLGRRNSHVGIYLGNQKFVHSPRAGKTVRIESMDLAYWKKRYNGARRLAHNDTAAAMARQP